MKICVTGGAGYVGTPLVNNLLFKGHEVTVLDTFWFGDFIKDRVRLRKIKGDIRSRNDLKSAFRGQDAVIHLACVSNDPSFDMNPELGKSINLDAFSRIIDTIKEEKVKRFIYASSSSVYGVSDLKDVTEDSPKAPLTDYSKFKLECEEMLEKYGTDGVWTIIRPATVCGYSERQRLDLVVNIMTTHAIKLRKITIFGRDQKRPNIHVMDMVRAYDWVIDAPDALIHKKIYNVGFENLSLDEIATLVKYTLKNWATEIIEKPTNDPRSYHINSDRILADGFKPVYSIADAIKSLKDNFDRLDNPLDNPLYSNIKQMKKLGL